MGWIQNFKGNLGSKLQQLFRYIKKHPIKTFFYLVLLGVMGVAILMSMIYFGVFGKLPTAAYLKGLKNPVTSTIYASNKEPVGYYFLQNRSNVDSTQISPNLKNALVGG
mgnify:FL=1